MTAVGRAGVAGAVSVLLLAGSARLGQAALGQAQASVETDRRHLKASVQTTLRTGYAVHEMTLPMGTTVKEFSSRTGLVFGVAWAGPRLPDLRQLLGSYFDTWLFAGDNNGVALQLPSVPDAGAPGVAGQLIFGIGTRANNALGAATVFAVDGAGNLTTTFRGRPYDSSYLDSGTNGIYFLDASTAGIPICTDASDFYCPPAPLGLSATIGGLNGSLQNVAFRIVNADTLFTSPNAAFDDLGGPGPTAFAWGLPFFYGRVVFTAIEQQSTPTGVGPFFAY